MRQQITIRIDRELLAAVSDELAKHPDLRQRDFFARALSLALEESRHLSVLAKQVRCCVASATAAEQRLLRGLAVAMVEMDPQTRWVLELPPPSFEQELMWEMCRRYLEYCNQLPHAHQCLSVYRHRGESHEPTL